MSRTTRRTDEEALDGEKFWPRHTGFKHICCDCNKTHIVDMGVEDDGAIWMRWRCDDRSTAARRRKKK